MPEKQIYLLTRQLVHLLTLEKEVRVYTELTLSTKKPFLKEKELIANGRNHIRTCCLPA